MRVQIELLPNHRAKLIQLALSAGFMREDPRKNWSEREYKEAIRWLILKIATDD